MNGFLKKTFFLLGITAFLTACGGTEARQQAQKEAGQMTTAKTEGVDKTDGSVYIPQEKRTGGKSVVYFTRDLSAAGLQKIYEKVNRGTQYLLCGRPVYNGTASGNLKGERMDLRPGGSGFRGYDIRSARRKGT